MRFPIVPTLALVAILSGGRAAAEQRFPPPDFSPGYSLPVTEAQGAPARADARGYIDAAVLAGLQASDDGAGQRCERLVE